MIRKRHPGRNPQGRFVRLKTSQISLKDRKKISVDGKDKRKETWKEMQLGWRTFLVLMKISDILLGFLKCKTFYLILNQNTFTTVKISDWSRCAAAHIAIF